MTQFHEALDALIEQCDLDAAYEFTRTGWMKGSDGIRLLAEIFARHRRTARTDALEEGLETAIRTVERRCIGLRGKDPVGWAQINEAIRILNAIRALIQPSEVGK